MRVIGCAACCTLLVALMSLQRVTGSNMPMGIAKQMNHFKSTSAFINSMVKPSPPIGAHLSPQDMRIFNSTRSGLVAGEVEIMAGRVVEGDFCDPRPSTVVIPPSSDPRIVYWPSCTKLDRCGGCTSSDLLECYPTEKNTVMVEVMQLDSTSSDASLRMDFKGNVRIPLEVHLACDTRCRVKPDDCTPLQDYDEHSCSCRCKQDGATSCTAPKKWDEKLCRCICPNLSNCLDDEFFDFNTCSCVKRQAMAASNTTTMTPSDMVNDPCSSYTCRGGQRKVVVGTGCECRPVRRNAIRRSRP